MITCDCPGKLAAKRSSALHGSIRRFTLTRRTMDLHRRFRVSVRHALAASGLGLILGVIATAQPSATGPTTAPATRSYTVAGHGDLRLTIPAGWSESEDAPQSGMPRTVRIT